MGTEFSEVFKWIDVIKDPGTPYAEQDTREHIVVPLLRAFGFEVDNWRELTFVRENNDHRLWDLNLYENNKLRLAIETKSAKIEIAKRQKRWELQFDDNAYFQLMRSFAGFSVRSAKKIQGAELAVGDIIALKDDFRKYLQNDEQFKAIVGSEAHMSLQLADWSDALKEFFLPEKPCEVCWDRILQATEFRFLVYRAAALQFNQDEDVLGQIWRYCLDGEHGFVHGKTLPVLTNGYEWVLFKSKFYGIGDYPSVQYPEKDSGDIDCDWYTYFNVLSDKNFEKVRQGIMNAQRELRK